MSSQFPGEDTFPFIDMHVTTERADVSLDPFTKQKICTHIEALMDVDKRVSLIAETDAKVHYTHVEREIWVYFPTVKDWSPVMALPKIKAWMS